LICVDAVTGEVTRGADRVHASIATCTTRPGYCATHALWLRELLAEGRLPEAWIPPEHIRVWRDIGVHRSDQTSRVGKLTRHGSPTLRWALYEAAQSATRAASPDYNDYHQLKARGLTHTRASLTIARKIARRSYHLLHALGPAALDPTD
jgi:hypothetical protein